MSFSTRQPAVETQPKKKKVARFGHVADTSAVCKEERACQVGRLAGGKLAKAQAYWRRKEALRKQPGRCGRCGQLSAERTCQKCRAYYAQRRAARRSIPAELAMPLLQEIGKRLSALETQVYQIQTYSESRYKRGYAVGMMAERRRQQRWQALAAIEAKAVHTLEEKRAVDHAYEVGRENDHL